MHLENRALVLDLIEWIAAKPRSYADVMDAWRTSCPRLSIWEDALGHELVACERPAGSELVVRVTSAGRTLLDAERPAPATAP